MQTFAQCPCCSGNTFVDCCKEIVAGTKFAETPLALMRSRYTAHVCKDMRHILRTMRSKNLKLLDDEKTAWFEQSAWNKLEIIDAPEPAEHAKEGIVEFKAYYTFQDTPQILHDRSKFIKENDQWFYITE